MGVLKHDRNCYENIDDESEKVPRARLKCTITYFFEGAKIFVGGHLPKVELFRVVLIFALLKISMMKRAKSKASRDNHEHHYNEYNDTSIEPCFIANDHDFV